MKEHPLMQFMVLGFTAVAFILLIKFLGEFLPDNGFPGTAKSLLRSV